MSECELCGVACVVTLALLRIVWETRSVRVMTCQSCGTRAWRTVTTEPPMIGADPNVPMLPWGSPSRRPLFRGAALPEF